MSIDLDRIDPSDAIDPAWYPQYEKEVDALWSQIINLCTNLYILDKIAHFPFEPLSSPNEVTFWTATYYSLFDDTILIVWKIAVDTGSDFLTLRSFKNEIFQNLHPNGPHPKEQLTSALAAKIKSVEFEKVMSEVEESVRELRHKYLAHFNRKRVTGITPRSSDPLPLSKLKEVKEAILRQFEALTFNKRFPYLPPQYSTDADQLRKTQKLPDIDRMLVNLASESNVIREPDEFPNRWKQRKKRLPAEDLQAINNYRVKLGLEPA